MILKSLKLQGFKSFADKTLLEFHKGVTAVVGPNGCGKSNIVDAIRWALGETSAKALRGAEMADVIFNGSDKRKPVGMAEVTLTFGDCEEALNLDFNEVAVTRRVYRDGRGEYLLNNKLCRLRDISELFMDTGVGRAAYSIMEQGKIDQLLSSKPEERRAVFEEAAGITKFKTQKREALRKLDYTEANLLRIRDIIAEVDRQLTTAQRQAQKAKRYQAIAQDARALDLHRCHRERSHFLEKHSRLRQSLRNWKQRALEHEIANDQQETHLERLRAEFQAAESVDEENRKKAAELQTRSAQSHQRSEFNREHNTERAQRITAHQREIAETLTRQTDQETQLLTAANTLSDAQKTITKLQAHVDNLQQTAATRETTRAERERLLRDARQERRSAEGKLSTLQGTRLSLERQCDTDAQRLAKLHTEAGTSLIELEQIQTEKTTQKQFVNAQEITLAQTEEERRFTEIDMQKLQTLRDTAQQDFLAIQKSSNTIKSRLDALRQISTSGEGLKTGAKYVLRGLDNPELYKSTLCGLLATKFQTTETWIPAIEAALGEFPDAIVVDTLENALHIAAKLRDTKKGRALLLAKNAVQTCTANDVFPSALSAIQAPEPIRSALAHLLRDVILVENSEDALTARHAHPHLTCVTRTGDRFTPDGIILGGAGQAETSPIRREHEIAHLTAKVLENEAVTKQKENSLHSLNADIATARQMLEKSTTDIQEHRRALAHAQGIANQLHRNWQQHKSRAESLHWETEQTTKRLADAREKCTQIETETTTVTAQLQEFEKRELDLTESLDAAQHDERAARESQAEARTALALEMRTVESLEERRNLVTGRIEETHALLQRRTQEIASLHVQVENAERENRAILENIRLWEFESLQLQATLTTAQENATARKSAQRDLEQSLDRHRRELRSIQEHLQTEEIENARVELKLESISEFVSQRYGIDIDYFQPDESQVLRVLEGQNRMRRQLAKKDPNTLETDPPETEEHEPILTGEADDATDAIDASDINWDEIFTLAAEMRRRMDAMGPVNLDSIQEFDDLTQRHQFLSHQCQDLILGKQELLKVIEKINTTTREMFEETFEQVRQNFRQTFRELFGQGAQADLSMIDKNDPLETGIEVTAKPPGKKPSSITLLSGGERSMTAVALLFSIYMVKPSPFCVLDELDAPLDESNIVRFLKMLDRFIEQSQFVIVTHNKRTMSRADILYGVTQEESGISKLVGINMTAAHTQNSHEEMPI